MARLEPAPAPAAPPGTRVVIDIRPLQEPERTPITAEYLERLLTGYADEPLAGESFVVLTRMLRDDPTVALQARGLPVIGRRQLPPTTRLFRSAGLTLDSFLLRGAEFMTERGADQSAPGRSVYHTAGGAVPLASRLPVVATLLDLAAWELPATYAASPAARFGHRLRARVLHDAARVIVCSRQVAETARRRLHLPAERLAVVPLAVDDAFRTAASDRDLVSSARARLALPERYLVFSGRYDARRDMATFFRALRRLRDESQQQPRQTRPRRTLQPGETRRPAQPRQTRRSTATQQPPLVVLAPQYDAEEDRDALQRAIARSGAQDVMRLAPPLDRNERAALIGGAVALVYPSLSEATGLPALEALSLGVPVVASRAGALPEIVGSAGIIVEPRDPARLATALGAVWAGGSLYEQLRRQARARAAGPQRTWSDVARETREVYAAAASAAGSAGST